SMEYNELNMVDTDLQHNSRGKGV
ncbi:hypothetical protein LCGC14_1476250, partial [marine sediment metagenome]